MAEDRKRPDLIAPLTGGFLDYGFRRTTGLSEELQRIGGLGNDRTDLLTVRQREVKGGNGYRGPGHGSASGFTSSPSASESRLD